MSNPMYSPPPGGQPPMGGGPMVNGQTIMVMGIVSIFCFGIVLGPIAWVQGNAALKTLDTYGDPTNQRSPVMTGRLCGMIGTGLAALGIIIYIIAIIAGVAGGLGHTRGVAP